MKVEKPDKTQIQQICDLCKDWNLCRCEYCDIKKEVETEYDDKRMVKSRMGY